MNSLLYEEFIKNNLRDKHILDECLKFEEKYQKHLYDFTIDEAIKIINSFPDTKQKKVKNLCAKYSKMASEQCFTKYSLNVFEMIEL